MRGFERQIDELKAAGIRTVAISVDSVEESAEMVKLNRLSFHVLSDQQNTAIKAYDLVHPGAGEEGRDIARSAEFLIDANGIVRWVNLTPNYTVRAKPNDILEAAKTLMLK